MLIDFLKNKGAAKEVAALLKTGQLATTTLSVFELWVGAETPDQIAHIETLLNALQIYQLNLAAAKMAGACHKNLQTSKNEIGMASVMVQPPFDIFFRLAHMRVVSKQGLLHHEIAQPADRLCVAAVRVDNRFAAGQVPQVDFPEFEQGLPQ